MIDLNLIRIDGGTQSRVELNQETVAEYAEAYKAGAEFPPVVVFFDGTDRWLADGYHRYFGAKAAGLTEIYENVTPGTKLDAELYSFGANGKHGLPRTNADKRKAVTGALQHPVSGKWSDNQIAKHCGVSQPFVSSVRASLQTVISKESAERTYTTKHGTEAVMKTANIGKPKSAPGPNETKDAPKAAPGSPATQAEALHGEEMAEDHGADFDPFVELQQANDENIKLRQLLDADDKAAEAMRWQSAYDVAQRRSDEHLQTIASRDKQIDFLSRQLKRCGKAVGEDDTDKIAPAVERVARAAKASA
ncbi:MAG: hypothetical protein Q7T70_02695 [Polaromonas sp.]|nr:hypothetical protein [Polaromonas sp.]